jgi:hypothetical protein
MNIGIFSRAAKDLEGHVQSLQSRVKHSLDEAGDLVCSDEETTPSGAPRGGMIRLIVSSINSKTREVMGAQDRLCQAAGMSGPFDLALRLLCECREG